MSWLITFLGELIKYIAPWIIKKVEGAVQNQISEAELAKRLKEAEAHYEEVMTNPNSTTEEKEKAHADFINAAHP
jgi:hypothetical protein